MLQIFLADRSKEIVVVLHDDMILVHLDLPHETALQVDVFIMRSRYAWPVRVLAWFHYTVKHHAVLGQRLAENNGDSQTSKMSPGQLWTKLSLCPVVLFKFL